MVEAGSRFLALSDTEAGSFLVVGVVLCIWGYLAASLASTHQMPVAPPDDNQKCLQTLPDVPWETKSPLFEIPATPKGIHRKTC